MFDKLNKAEQRYAQVEQDLSNPEIISNQEAFTKLMKEYSSLTPVIEKFREYKTAEKQMSDAEDLMHDKESDADIKELAEDEYKEAKLLKVLSR